LDDEGFEEDGCEVVGEEEVGFVLLGDDDDLMVGKGVGANVGRALGADGAGKP